MNYQRIYDELVERAKARVLDEREYRETHHIVPECMGGLTTPENLVNFTPEEHFVAHQLLVRIYPGVRGLIYACIAMTGDPHGKRGNNKAYGWIRRMVSEARRGTKPSDEARRKHSETNKARGIRPPDSTSRKATPEARANMSKAQKGRTITEEHRKNLSKSKKGTKAAEETKALLSSQRRGVPKSAEHRQAISQGLTGLPHSDERRQKDTKSLEKARAVRRANLEAKRAEVEAERLSPG